MATRRGSRRAKTCWRRRWNTRSTTSMGSSTSIACRASTCWNGWDRKRRPAPRRAAGSTRARRDTQLVTQIQSPPSVRDVVSQVAQSLAPLSDEAYVTGGFLRDVLMERPVKDIDVSIGRDPLGVAPLLAEALGGPWFPLDEEKRFARILLQSDGLHLDLLPLRGELRQDLLSRDFTIDAMAVPLPELAGGVAEVIDPAGGLRDLQDKLVRATREQAFLDDPLRLLRGVRLAVQLGFALEPRTAEMVRRHAMLVSRPAPERRRDELMLIMAAPAASDGLRLLEELGLLPVLLPEMDVARGVEQPKEHYWDVFGHSLAAVERLDVLLAEREPKSEPERWLWRELWERVGFWEGARIYLAEEVAQAHTRSALLKLAGLLHDVGKPKTKSFDDTGRMRFFGHADAGEKIAEKVLRRLHFSTREVSLVGAMVKAHLRPVQMAQQGPPSNRAIYRFFRDTGGAGIETLFLSLADHLATVGPGVNKEGWRTHVAMTAF